MNTEIIFYHGWGFDSQAWNAWIAELGNGPDIKCSTPDRGYFGNPQVTKAFAPDAERKVVVAHSLGLHFVPDEVLRECDMLVLVGAFLGFHPPDEIGRKRSQRILKLMKAKLQHDSLRLVQDFWTDCYNLDDKRVQLLPPGHVDADRLEQDLDFLDSNEIHIGALEGIPTVLVVNAGMDRIVHPSRLHELQSFVDEDKFFFLEDAPHAVAFTHSDVCIEILSSYINRKHWQPCYQLK